MELPFMEPIYIAFGVFLIVTVYCYLKPKSGRNYTCLDTEEAKDKLSGDVLLIDVRNRSEYIAGHIQGARNISLDQLDQKLTELPRDRDIVVYCQIGGRSIRAIRKLEIAGFNRLYHMRQGFRGWNNSGYPYRKKHESK
jgi:hydroxyacylglutathione hydrolase